MTAHFVSIKKKSLLISAFAFVSRDFLLYRLSMRALGASHDYLHRIDLACFTDSTVGGSVSGKPYSIPSSSHLKSPKVW